jgi:enterochelin esterase family protein
VATDVRRRATAPPEVSSDGVLFTYRDTRPTVRGLHLAHVMSGVRTDTEFQRVGRSRTWQLWFPRPPVDRFEYGFSVHHRGGDEWLLDPTNPSTTPNPFGPTSVIEFPEYEAPAWVEHEAPDGSLERVELRSRALRARVAVDVWSSPGAEAGKPLPLLVVHDGPETAQYTLLLRLLGLQVAAGGLPPLRAALLHPVRRDDTYSASAAYARALANEIMPAIAGVAPTPHRRRMRIAMGASLGALAAFHAHREHEDLFGGLFLNSGSFFRRRDAHEKWFPRFERIARFTSKVERTRVDEPIPVTVTVGLAEENLDANRNLADVLERQGYDVVLHENRDAHTWAGWRDTYDPRLLELLRKRWA